MFDRYRDPGAMTLLRDLLLAAFVAAAAAKIPGTSEPRNIQELLEAQPRLHTLVSAGDQAKFAAALQESTADIDAVGLQGMTALTMAATLCRPQLAQMLIEAGADATVQKGLRTVGFRNEAMWSALVRLPLRLRPALHARAARAARAAHAARAARAARPRAASPCPAPACAPCSG